MSKMFSKEGSVKEDFVALVTTSESTHGENLIDAIP